MSTKTNSCPVCGKSGGLAKMTGFGKEKNPGSFCKKCSSFFADKQSRTREASCESCKKKVGPVSELVDVVVDGTRVHRGEPSRRIMCPSCSETRVKAGKHDQDEVLTRYETLCMGGCGNVQGWIDAPEGTENVDLKVGYCDVCAVKAAAQTKDAKTLDSLVKDAASNP